MYSVQPKILIASPLKMVIPCRLKTIKVLELSTTFWRSKVIKQKHTQGASKLLGKPLQVRNYVCSFPCFRVVLIKKSNHILLNSNLKKIIKNQGKIQIASTYTQLFVTDYWHSAQMHCLYIIYSH